MPLTRRLVFWLPAALILLSGVRPAAAETRDGWILRADDR
jgi:hypothetical protein